ncbi:MAG: hypothetical protein SRB1_02309 [Desulfobacteraceae bacterium Eth-SRB1]|nr:MAG: hypothetical protein SRB1_02309 [Desulfobacteraceae bacterium Eth-SRB1]
MSIIPLTPQVTPQDERHRKHRFFHSQALPWNAYPKGVVGIKMLI